MGRSEQFVWVEVLSSYGEIRKLYATSDEKLQWRVWKVGVTKLAVKAHFMPLQKQQFWAIVEWLSTIYKATATHVWWANVYV